MYLRMCRKCWENNGQAYVLAQILCGGGRVARERARSEGCSHLLYNDFVKCGVVVLCEVTENDLPQQSVCVTQRRPPHAHTHTHQQTQLMLS